MTRNATVQCYNHIFFCFATQIQITVILKATWPENQKDTREKIRKCRAGEKEGQVTSEEKSTKEGSVKVHLSSAGLIKIKMTLKCLTQIIPNLFFVQKSNSSL